MKFAILITASIGASAANAHPGHLAEVAGHGHWLGAAAIGAAIAIGLWGALKGGKPKASDEDPEAQEEDAELQEA